MAARPRGARTPKDKVTQAAPAAPRARPRANTARPDPNMDPSLTSSWYDVMSPRWLLVSDVMGGTESMRAAGDRRLPRHPEETDSSWERRLEQAVLFNVTSMTVDTLAGYPFSEPIVLQQDVPERIRQMAEDIDLRGTHLDVFAKEWFIKAFSKCFCHVLVEFPRAQAREDGEPRTMDDDRRDGLRPYWVMIEPEDLHAARSQVINGREVLTHVRYRQLAVSHDGFAESSKVQIHVREPGRHEVWEEVEVGARKEWQRVDEWEVRLPGGGLAPVTLATLYTSRAGFMLGRPPVEDLAHLNVAHWQSYSDQRNILSVARFPMLAASGVDDDDAELEVGPNQLLTTADANARFYYVEHSGKAIASGAQDLKELEDRMSAYGADFLKKRPTVYTATGRVIDQHGILSPLQTMTISARDAIELALQFTALWLGEEQGGSVKLNDEFGPQPIDSADMAALQAAWENGAIDDEAFLMELQRRKTLSPDLDITRQLAGIAGRQAKKLKDQMSLKIPAEPEPSGPGAAPNSGNTGAA